MNILSKEQQVQEDQYRFPYHYLDLEFDLYKNFKHRHYLKQLLKIKNILSPYCGQRLLDVGCGDGRFCYELSKENLEIYGIDYSERAIRFAKAFNPNVNFFLKDVSKLDFENYFDIITMIEVLEHIKPDEVQSNLRLLSMVLKSKGKFLISVPSKNLPLSSKHYQHFDINTIVDYFKDDYSLIQAVGYVKSGEYWNNYMTKVKLVEFLWPLQNKVPLVKKYFNRVTDYYSKIENCTVEEANTLILLFEKK